VLRTKLHTLLQIKSCAVVPAAKARVIRAIQFLPLPTGARWFATKLASEHHKLQGIRLLTENWPGFQ
jgi:hypothetical protein